MRLASRDGIKVELRPIRYQFKQRQTRFKGRRSRAGSKDWDANWLVVRGDIATADGLAWSFEDPCLTTWEAQSLGAWLREKAVHAPSQSSPPDPPSLIFTEPNLAFGWQDSDDDRVRLLAYFSLEARPPWLRNAAEPPEVFEFFLPLDVTRQDLAHAADEWDRELTLLPER